MYRFAAVVLFSSVGLAQSPQQAEIVQAAKSPYDLARYINSHDDIEWEPLWQALGVDQQLGLPCSRNCSAEIMAIENPEQVILIVNASLPFDAYLRFEKGSADEWRVTGKYFANVWDGNPHRHGIVRAGSTQFLVVSAHGGHGSGLDEEREDWFDLSGASFQPVFSYSVRGHFDIMGAGISTEIEAGAYPSSSVEIELHLTVYLSCPSGGLGRFEFTGLYTRAADGDFSLKEARTVYPASQIPRQEFDDFSRVGQASDEEEIKYAMPRLKEIAAGDNGDAKMWLRRILDRVGDTPEKRALLELLAKP